MVFLNSVHNEWKEDIRDAFEAIDGEYKEFLKKGNYIPEKEAIFNAFKTLPKSNLRYILFGQDPYPRVESAVGYAFIDGAVKRIFSSNGLDKRVNRATSLRNFIKMALVASKKLSKDDLSQEAIAKLDKSELIDSIDELRENFEKNGVLLLNTALVFESKNRSSYHVKKWRPFIEKMLYRMDKDVKLILFGNIAKSITKIPVSRDFEIVDIEHPYNHSFILNKKAIKLFAPMNLLQKNCYL